MASEIPRTKSGASRRVEADHATTLVEFLKKKGTQRSSRVGERIQTPPPGDPTKSSNWQSKGRIAFTMFKATCSTEKDMVDAPGARPRAKRSQGLPIAGERGRFRGQADQPNRGASLPDWGTSRVRRPTTR